MPHPSLPARRRRQAAVRLLLAPTMLAAGLVALAPAQVAQAGSDVADFQLHLDAYPSGGFEGYADPGRFQFFDGDLPPDLSAITVQVRSTSDPAGVTVFAERQERSSAYYFGAVPFSPDGGALSGALRVSDGDTVTVSYVEAQGSDGQPHVHERSALWSARTRPPDFRQVGLVDTAEAAATVRGARAAAPPGSTVRVYDPAASGGPVLSGAADEAGRFLLTSTGDLPADVQVTSQEAGLPESPPLDLRRARITGRVVTPGVEVGVVSALVEPRPEGAPDPCAGFESCRSGPGLTDNDGYLHQLNGPGQGFFTGDAGAYDLYVYSQGVPDEARWGAAAYGDSGPFPIVLPEGAQTVDVGLLPLDPPTFEGVVLDSLGQPVVGAVFDTYDPQGAYVVRANGTSRAGGEFALRLPDGDYQVRVAGPHACQGYGVATLELTVREGRTTPATATVVLERFGVVPEVVDVPTPGSSVGTTLRLARSGLEVTLPPDDQPGSVSVACTATPVEDRELVRPPVSVEGGVPAGEVTVCLDYDPAEVARLGADEQDVELVQVQDDGSSTVLTRGPGAEVDRLCGQTTSLSTFAVALPAGSAAVPEPARARLADDACPSERVPEDGMTDVAADDAHEASVDCALWWGVARGRSSTEYAPGRSVTRAQMASFVANLVERTGGALPTATRDWFSDDQGSDHERSINLLAEAGIVQGRADGGYGPEVAVDRDAMATFLVRAYERSAGQALPATRDWFSDDDGNAHEPSIDRAAEAGFTGGAAGGGYAPRNPVTRASMASFLVRVLDLAVERRLATAPS